MDIRICNFKVYLLQSVSGRIEGWTFYKPWGDPQGADIVIGHMSLWDLLYKVEEEAKLSPTSKKSLVTKTDLYWLLKELATIGHQEDGKTDFERIAEANIKN